MYLASQKTRPQAPQWVPFTATDPDAGATLSFSLVDDNATSNASFNLSTAGALTTAEILDFENNASHALRVLVSDEFNAIRGRKFHRYRNQCGRGTSHHFGGGGATATFNMGESQRGVTSISASEPDGQALSYSIIGGNDASLFSIDPSSGELSFNTAPDYENPNDSNWIIPMRSISKSQIRWEIM